MLRRIDLRGKPLDPAALEGVLPRAASEPGTARAAVQVLIDDVRERGADALLEQADRFDGGRPPALRVAPAELRDALDGLDASLREALSVAIGRALSGGFRARGTCVRSD